MESFKRKREGRFLRNFVRLMCFFSIPVVCLLFVLSLSLPEVSLVNHNEGIYRKLIPGKRLKEVELGELGELMVALLPDDLAFTIFVPSEEAFRHVLKLWANDSLVEDKMTNTFAILSRVMGFSAVPRHLPSAKVPLLEEITFDSLSGYRLHAWKVANGTLIVNNVRSERVDISKAQTIIHIMSGVIMDPEFEQSFVTDNEE